MPTIQEVFANGKGWIHQLDPGTKIFVGFILSIEVALATRFETLLAAALLALFLVIGARLPFAQVLRRLFIAAGFIALIWLIMPLTYEGQPFYHWGPLTWTLPGIQLSARITIKSLTILTLFMTLFATMPVSALGHGLHRLHLPNKLIFLLLMTYRYIFVMEEEYHRLARAAKIRGFSPGTNLHTYKTYAYLIGMLFVRAKARADRVYQAMRCRAFNGRFRTLQVNASNPALQVGFVSAMLAAGALLAYLEW